MHIFYQGVVVGLLHKLKYSFNTGYGTHEGKTQFCVNILSFNVKMSVCIGKI
jgi:hypothetical protein